MENALTLDKVKKSYKGFTLDIEHLSLPTGCVMGFIGENGAGKSTTIKAILGLLRPDSGTISVLGKENGAELADIKENIGAVIEESCFPEALTVKDVDGVMRAIYRTWDSGRFFSLTDRFALPREKRIKEFSKGMKMKLSIAAALSHDSRLLILDEATTGLDPIVRDEVLEIFLDFMQDETHSIFISSHIISDLEKICDYVTFIHKGKILFSEAKDELLETYGILKCSEEDLKAVPAAAVKGVSKNRFGAEALVDRSKLRNAGNAVIDPAGIEDIMLFMVKSGNAGCGEESK